MTKRGKDDVKWQEVKKAVYARDRVCRLILILTAKEFIILQSNAGIQLHHCDPAHVFSVGANPKEELVYNPLNIVKLNRYSHTNLDSMRNPLNGDMITYEDRENWWKRIVGTEIYTELLNLSKNDDTK